MKKLFFLFLLVANTVAAQTVLNPTRVTFTASPDHNATVGGIPLVDHYELRHFLSGANTPVQVQSIGKPTPNAQNVCTAGVTSLPVSSTNQYTAKVAAVGPTGEGISTASNSYFFVAPPEIPANVTLTK